MAFICGYGYFLDIGYQLALILNGGEEMQEALSTVIDAPLNEELLKAIGLLIVYRCLRKEFDSLTDFVIYACFVAIGFQFLENLSYMSFALDSTDNAIEAWNDQLRYRVIYSGFMHLFWTSWSGVGLWLFVHGEKKFLPRFIQLLGFVSLAIFLHLANNLAAVIPNLFGGFLYEITRSITIALFISLIGLAVIKDISYLFRFSFRLLEDNRVSSLKNHLSGIKQLSNPIYQLLARYPWSWRVSSLGRRALYSRKQYQEFSKYALAFSKLNRVKDHSSTSKEMLIDKACQLIIENNSNIQYF